ncbi:hypothetical protein ABG82_02735 [Mycobacteroides immunogenum]|uniref:Uncharacterized protein n=2 Tax=Mycobacteroides TaxID=670516 RepID=A0A4R8QVP7_9MYCO|nr:hypothetical protein ABG82_02735 [Mycobacteroides immunogenum]TDZ44526.1 hypothetical protein CCUG64054_04591 [Mycobacteroides franklinii]ANO02464.1 hypothetical protein BAB75_02740 [Mycobacteroides immunogenum]KIU38710.1 hypothetical protein TL11_20765 [Mycobacteroides immunogenum]KPG08578.1 hypothetical protein AN909_14810 [Mycobacteroides immunogenum]
MIPVAVMAPLPLAVIGMAFMMARMLIALVCGRVVLGMPGCAELVSLMVPGMVGCGVHPPNIYP